MRSGRIVFLKAASANAKCFYWNVKRIKFIGKLNVFIIEENVFKVSLFRLFTDGNNQTLMVKESKSERLQRRSKARLTLNKMYQRNLKFFLTCQI